MKKWMCILLLILVCMGAVVGALADELQAPSDFVFDTESGKFTFVSNDENAGYYFVRVYPVVNGEEAIAYVSSSKRINAGKTGEKSGKVNVSSIGWGEYHVKLITFAASGTNYSAPAPVILNAFYGVGGKLERPEIMAVSDGNTVEITLDWYTLSHWKDFQYMPTVRFSVYSDADCQNLVDTQDVATSEIVMDTHPTGAYIWQYSLTAGHMNFVTESRGPDGSGEMQKYCLIPEATFTETAGTYYVTAQAISDDESKIASSDPSEALEVTLTDDEPDFETFEVRTSSLWTETPVMGMPTAASSGAEGRVDAAAGQTVTSTVQ